MKMKRQQKQLWMSAVILIMIFSVAVEVKAISVQEDQAIDEQLGLFNRTFSINLPRLCSRQNLPSQMQPGKPPFSQQVQRSTDVDAQGLESQCIVVVPFVCPPGPPCPPTPPKIVRIC